MLDFYFVGKLVLLKKTFKVDFSNHTEFIHCVITEHLEVLNDKPTLIKVEQITDLENYINNGTKENSVYRTIRMSEVEFTYED